MEETPEGLTDGRGGQTKLGTGNVQRAIAKRQLLSHKGEKHLRNTTGVGNTGTSLTWSKQAREPGGHKRGGPIHLGNRRVVRVRQSNHNPTPSSQSPQNEERRGSCDDCLVGEVWVGRDPIALGKCGMLSLPDVIGNLSRPDRESRGGERRASSRVANPEEAGRKSLLKGGCLDIAHCGKKQSFLSE